VRDVEPWREGHVELKGRVKEQHLQDETGKKILIPFFPGERVRFNIKDNNRVIKTAHGTKKGYKAVDIEVLSEYKPKTLTE
jgi:hypothetical protein